MRDYQIQSYINARKIGLTQVEAATIASISVRTGQRIEAKKHRSTRELVRDYRTRLDPLVEVWETELKPMLVQDPYSKPSRLFEYLQKKYPGKYLRVRRTLQRRVSQWKKDYFGDFEPKIKVQSKLSDFLRSRKGSKWKYKKLYFIDHQYEWEYMHNLLQGKFIYEELLGILSNELEDDEIYELYDYVIKGGLKYRNRAMVVLAHVVDIPELMISKFLVIDLKSVRRYIQEYKSCGISRLFDFSRNKIYKSEDKKYIDKVFEILHSPPSDYDINRTTWKMDDIKKIMDECDMKISIWNIRKIIRKAGYKVRSAKKVLTSRDPDYREKLQNIQSILSNLGSKEKFFSIDEFGPFAIKIHGGKALTPPGQFRTVPQWQKSKGSLIATAALELSSNQISHFYSDKKNTKEMIKLIGILLEEYRNENCIYISWDAASWHASQELYKYVESVNTKDYRNNNKTPIVKLAPLPSGAQFLNVIESVFSGMSRAILRNSNYESVEHCKKAIDRYIDERNHHFKENPKRAGNKIWGSEVVKPVFSESNNCKDPLWR